MRSNLHGKSCLVFIFILLVSCSPKNGIDENEMQATIDAAIIATQTAQNEMESMVSASVSATLTAMPSPTPLALDQMGEEELAAAVESSTVEAVSAADEAAVYAETASSDGELTQDEIDELYYLYYWSIEELEQALALVDTYYDLYDELLDAVITDLESIENELQSILTAAEEVLGYLDEIAVIISNGQQVAQEKLDQLQAISGAISSHTANISAQLPGWKGSRTGELERIADLALSTLPDAVADTRLGALQIAKEYLDQIKVAVGDGKFSQLELQSLSQLGANAAASLGKFGGDLAALPAMINGITGSFARGQLPQINAGIGTLQGALPSIR